MKITISNYSVLSLFVLLWLSMACKVPNTSRGFAYSNKKTAKGYGAYGYVLLSSGSVTNSGRKYERLVKTANAFIENFPPPASKLPANEKARLMVTHWLLRKQVRQVTAAALVTEYDYSRSLEMLGSLKMTHKEGPILVAWKKPFEELDKTEKQQMLVFDLSRFSEEDIDRAFRLWRKMLSEDVDQWNKPGNKLVKFREEVRNGFQQYGQTLFDLISIIY